MAAGRLISRGPVNFVGDLTESEDFSAIDLVGERLILANDESNVLDLLEADGSDFQVVGSIPLGGGDEIDVEGITHEGSAIYVVGSHSLVRKKVEDDKTYKKNRSRLAEVKRETSRESLFRLTLGAGGNVVDRKVTSLRAALEGDEYLKRFLDIPGKENGVDIEGIAVANGRLYVGFRGPVLRGNFVPVLVCDFDDPASGNEVIFVNLDGRGVRDLARVTNGFLILAGPISDGDDAFRLYHWDGLDVVPGDRPAGHPGVCTYLCDVPAEPGRKPEGIAVTQDSGSAIEMIVVFDGPIAGGAVRYRLERGQGLQPARSAGRPARRSRANSTKG